MDYTFGAEYRRQQGINGKGNSLGFFFSAPLPVFNRNQGEIARARAEQEQLAQDAGRSARADFERSGRRLAGVRNARAPCWRRSSATCSAPSQEAANTTAYVYKAGASSLIDVLDAQRAFNETMSAYYGAQADYRRASSRLASAVGQEVIP